MKMNSRIALFVVALLFAAVEMRAQESTAVRPRTIAGATHAQQTPAPAAAPQTVAPQTATALPKPDESESGLGVIEAKPQKNAAAPLTFLTPSVVQARISEARRMLGQGAVKLGGAVLGGDDLDLDPARLDGAVLQVGKRQFRRLLRAD